MITLDQHSPQSNSFGLLLIMATKYSWNIDIILKLRNQSYGQQVAFISIEMPP